MVLERYISRFAASPIPAEEQPPLLIRADGMETIQLSFQLLKVITGRKAQVQIADRIVQHLQPERKAVGKIGRNSLVPFLLDKEIPEPRIAKTRYHNSRR